MNRRNTRKYFLSAAFFAIGALIIFAENDKVTLSHDEAYRRNLSIFNALTRQLEEHYVDSIRPDAAFKGAIDGMLATVDPYTEYYSYDDRDALMRLTTGSYGGIGAFITTSNGKTFISEPIPGSPAFREGLKPGDHILMVDTVDVSKKSSDEVSKLLRGQQGTRVDVRIGRPYIGSDSIMQFSLLREKVVEPSIPWWGVVDGNIGYIKLNQFIESSAPGVKLALDSFKVNPDVKYIVLDLRGNGGGLVESAIDILGNFLPKGTEVLRTKGKNAASEKVYKTQRNPIFPDIPLAVFIDGGSASASEITAGALQDLDRAVLIGSRSFGKGLVQGMVTLPYNAMLKVTQAKYYIPSGRLIQALDYSNRTEDGKVARVPDSLTNIFHTSRGREVRDGGGLTPDSIVDWGNKSALIYGLVVGNHIFNYANKYVATHPKPENVATFTLSDEDFEEFASGIDAETFKYDKICSQIIDNLKQTAESEGYMNDEIKEIIETLQKKLDHDLKSDIYTKRQPIEEYLTEEIAARYWPGTGRTQRELVGDKALEAARLIFSTPGLYNKILNN